jgi:hypothetical protein
MKKTGLLVLSILAIGVTSNALAQYQNDDATFKRQDLYSRNNSTGTVPATSSYKTVIPNNVIEQIDENKYAIVGYFENSNGSKIYFNHIISLTLNEDTGSYDGKATAVAKRTINPKTNAPETFYLYVSKGNDGTLRVKATQKTINHDTEQYLVCGATIPVTRTISGKIERARFGGLE